MIEKGRRIPSVRALRAIAAKLGVSAEYLETGHEGPLDLELRLTDAELALRLDRSLDVEQEFAVLLQDAEQVRDRASADRARVGLALTAYQRGAYAETIGQLEPLLLDRELPVAAYHDLYAALGRSYAASGDSVRAVALFDQCLAELGEAEQCDSALYVRFASYLSYALVDVGDSVRAHQVLADALRRGESAPDRYTTVRLYWSLGRYYRMEGSLELAVDYMRQAISLLEITEDMVQLASAHEFCATVLLEQGVTDSVSDHLELAERLYKRQGADLYLGSLRTEWARLALELGDLELARERALEALDLLDVGMVEPDDHGRAWRTLGDIFVRLGDDDLAGRAYRSAIEILEVSGTIKQLTDAYASYGSWLNAVGNSGEAIKVMRRALEIASTRKRIPSGDLSLEGFAELSR